MAVNEAPTYRIATSADCILKSAGRFVEKRRSILVLGIDGRALDDNESMRSVGYAPGRQLIDNARQTVFADTVPRDRPRLARRGWLMAAQR